METKIIQAKELKNGDVFYVVDEGYKKLHGIKFYSYVDFSTIGQKTHLRTPSGIYVIPNSLRVEVVGNYYNK